MAFPANSTAPGGPATTNVSYVLNAFIGITGLENTTHISVGIWVMDTLNS